MTGRGPSSGTTIIVALVIGSVIGACLVLATVAVIGRPASQTTVYSTVTTASSATVPAVTTFTSVSTYVVTVNRTVTVSSVSNGSVSPGAVVVESGALTVPTGSGTGSVVVTVKNDANNSIVEVTVTPDSSVISLNGENPGAGWVMSSGSLIHPGSSDSAQTSVSAAGSGLTAGTTYAFTVVVTFSGGADNVQTLSLTAQV